MIVVLADPDPSGLASMIASLIEQNLARDPARERLLQRTIATIEAPDVGVSVIVRLSPGRVEVADGSDPASQVVIVADSSSLLVLTAAPLRFGLPDVFRSRGRAIVRDVLARRIKIRGLLSHPRRLARISCLLSVE